MDKAKTNTESITSSTAPVAGDITQRKNLFNGVVYILFREAVDEMGELSEAQRQEEFSDIAHFMKMAGARINRPYHFMYMGFRMGLSKGLELAAKLESKA